MLAPFRKFARSFLNPLFRAGPKKPLARQMREAAALWRFYRYPPYHYVQMGLFAADAPEPVTDVFPNYLAIRRRRPLQSDAAAAVLEDKRRFADWVDANALPAPATIWRRTGGAFDAPDGPLDQAQAIVRALASPAGVIVKPRFGGRGRGVSAPRMSAAGIAAALDVDEDLIAQTRLAMHPDLAGLSDGALNTLRVDTTRLDRRWRHSGAYYRMGFGGGIADNASLGGLFADVDLATGRLGAVAKTKAVFSGDRWRAHPTSGAVFGDVVLPDFDAALALAVRAAEALEGAETIGWDIALTDDGPKLIEGNLWWNLKGMQEACGGLRRRPIGRLLFGDPPAF